MVYTEVNGSPRTKTNFLHRTVTRIQATPFVSLRTQRTATAACDGCVLSQCACRGAAAAAWSPTKNYHDGGAILMNLSTPMMTMASSRGMNHSSAREELVEKEKEVEGEWLE